MTFMDTRTRHPQSRFRLFAAIAILFTPLAYLVLLKQPPVRAAWLYLFKDFVRFLAVITPAIIHLFSYQSVKQMVRAVISLKKFPDTLDEWITFCVLPFKTCIIVTFPMIWILPSSRIFLSMNFATVTSPISSISTRRFPVLMVWFPSAWLPAIK